MQVPQQNIMSSILFSPLGSPQLVTYFKIMRQLVRLWRARGLKAIVYLYDSIVAVKGKHEAVEDSKQVKTDKYLHSLIRTCWSMRKKENKILFCWR